MKVAVIGGGFAGLSAAIALQERRHQVTLLERRGVLGGRATSYRDALSGEDVDNGTHLMIGAYAATLDLARRAGAEDLLLVQDELRIDWVDERGYATLECPPLRAPLHLMAGLLSLRLPWSARLGALRLGLAVRFGKPPVGVTLAEYFRRTGQGPRARRLLWDPLALAILNDTPERAAAVLFYNVYREAFLASHRASRLVFLRRGYGELHARLAGYLEGRGGRVCRRARAEAIVVEQGRARGVRYAQQPETRDEIRRGKATRAVTVEADAVIAAVPWHAVPGLLPEALRSEPPFDGLARLGSAPIVSVEMWLDRVVVDRPMVGLRDSEVEWVFDKGRLYGRAGPPQHLAFIVSAAYRSVPRPNAELTAAAEAALRRFFPAMAGACVERTLVMREPQATFAGGPEAELLRPGPVTPVPGLFLAGDWTSTGLPATIEGAVRSGLAAARATEKSAG
jgi:squalene-associated FAD-dependent desaturase